MRATLVVLALLAAPLPLSPALAAHECEYAESSAVGIDVATCTDAQGRPHFLQVKDETLGGVQVSHTFFSTGHTWFGGDFQAQTLTIWTYSNTPTGRSWIAPFFWCADYDYDGTCDWVFIGASTYARGFFNQVNVDRDPSDGTWRLCTLVVTGWSCTPLVEGPGVPMFPEVLA